MRHEVISLQNAASGGAESYPSCFQLQVAGSKSTLSPSAFVSSLSSNSTIRFPGGYNKNDPGWKVDVYTDPQNLDYSKMFPGPPISDAVKTGSGGGDGGVVNSTTTSSVHTPTKTPLRNLPHPTTTASPTTSPASPVRVITTTITQTFVLTMTLDNSNGPQNTTTTSHPNPAATSLSSTTTGTVSTPLPRRSAPHRVVPIASLQPHVPIAAEKRHLHRAVPFSRHH